MSARMPRLAGCFPLKRSHNPRAGNAGRHCKTKLVKLLGDNLGRPEFLKAKFRMHMEVMPDGGEFACEASKLCRGSSPRWYQTFKIIKSTGDQEGKHKINKCQEQQEAHKSERYPGEFLM